ncbi:MAG: hypothetical protein JOY77_07575 [Alphaproteobacteria bacterium]|uniref:hypothetical protein n=1 Tax=Bradyrhizobium sp. TaxID=376 RepID=UPI001DB72E25|nr:hypothetical protein [Bradyrhizobium sp.]MBV9062775.1 hypothetical protein [Alphaproteobacteria bacterium]MBV9560026.1 hypothetical protein [Bradyrhizobium sp.]
MFKSNALLNRDSGLSKVLAETRELVRQASQLLRQPAVDTFLGRKTQEPFPEHKKN